MASRRGIPTDPGNSGCAVSHPGQPTSLNSSSIQTDLYCSPKPTRPSLEFIPLFWPFRQGLQVIRPCRPSSWIYLSMQVDQAAKASIDVFPNIKVNLKPTKRGFPNTNISSPGWLRMATPEASVGRPSRRYHIG